MGAVTTFLSGQGLDGRDIELDADESAIISFLGGVYWDRGGVSVSVFPDTNASGEMVYEHSLTADGDDWTPQLGSPFKLPTEISEQARVTRIRVRAPVTAGKAQVLSPVPVKVEFEP